MKKIKKCAQLILILFIVLLSSCSKQFTPEELYSKNMNSVVEVKVNCNDDNLYASAVCIDSNGLFVSNANVGDIFLVCAWNGAPWKQFAAFRGKILKNKSSK